MRRLLSVLVVVAVLAGAGVAVYRTTRPGPRSVVFDLAERLPFAMRTGTRETIMFGWPDSEPRIGTGFGGDPEYRGRERFLWVRQGASILVNTPEPRDRSLVFDIEAYKGIEDQRLTVSINGKALGVQDIPSVRSRVVFDWPAASQSASNELTLLFSRAIVPAEEKGGSGDTRDFAAALFSLTIGDSADRTLDLLSERDTPRAFEVTEKDGVPSIVLPAGAQTSFAFRLPEGAALEFESTLLPWSVASGGQGSLRVTFDATDGTKRDAVDVPLKAQSSGATRIRLKGAVGTPFMVRMEVNSDKPGVTFATLRAPRILGASAISAKAPPKDSVAPLSKAIREAKPNVLFIVLDAARAQSFSVYGNARKTTPNIDALAQNGFVFDNAYTTAVYTNAAMSSVWTSQQPDRHHGNLAFAAKLPKDKLMLAEILSAQGVHTAGFVANQVAGTFNGFDRGFKEFEEPFKKYGSQASSFRNYLPAFLDRMKTGGSRFFGYVHYREPHHPYDPPPPFNTAFGPDAPIPKSRREGGDAADRWLRDINQGVIKPTAEEVDHLRRLYDGNLAFADSEIGYLRGELEARGLLDNTIIIVTGDHGEALLEHGYIGHNAQVYEESAHIPLIVSLPKALRAAFPPARVASLVDLTDIAPTVLDVFGLTGAGGSAREFQGRSLLSLAGEPSTRATTDTRELLTRTIWARPVYAIRNTSHTFVYNSASDELALYDRSTPTKLEDAEHDFAPRAPIALRETYRQHLLAWVASLKQQTGAADKPVMTRAQCEEFKALGYLDSRTVCPTE